MFLFILALKDTPLVAYIATLVGSFAHTRTVNSCNSLVISACTLWGWFHSSVLIFSDTSECGPKTTRLTLQYRLAPVYTAPCLTMHRSHLTHDVMTHTRSWRRAACMPMMVVMETVNTGVTCEWLPECDRWTGTGTVSCVSVISHGTTVPVESFGFHFSLDDHSAWRRNSKSRFFRI